MTDPAATVVLGAVVTVPSVNAALTIAVVAAACVRLTTDGTEISDDPAEMTSATKLPVAADVPAAGSCVMMAPAGTVVLDAVVIAPTARPALTIVVVAAACVRSTTFGTVTSGGPDETTSATAVPTGACVPAAG